MNQTTMLPTSNGRESSEDRYARCVRSWNIAVARYTSACDAYDSARAEVVSSESANLPNPKKADADHATT